MALPALSGKSFGLQVFARSPCACDPSCSACILVSHACYMPFSCFHIYNHVMENINIDLDCSISFDGLQSVVEFV